jgi:hypothetical protein
MIAPAGRSFETGEDVEIYLLRIRNFRGFDSLELCPKGHVLLSGEPRAGRSTVVDALYRVLSPNGSRGSVSHDLDIRGRDRDSWAEVEVVLGDLSEDLTQRFFDQLEFWDSDEGGLVDELDDAQDLDEYEAVVRLCYRQRWNTADEIGEQWVDYPKSADPENDLFVRVRRTDLEALPVFFSRPSGSPLSLAHESGLRRIIEGGEQGDFGETLESFAGKVEGLGGELAEADQLSEALGKIVGPISSVLDSDAGDLAEGISFVPAGVALGALLRGLEPTLRLGDEEAALPLSRHGATASAALTAAELLVRGEEPGGVIVHDDFGEGLDGPTSAHLVSLLRKEAGQAWITTRRAEVASAFKLAELVRLGFNGSGERVHFQGRRPKSKAERMASRHVSLQLLPMLTARALIVLEGPHDLAALRALEERRLRRGSVPLLAAARIGLIHAGAIDSAGGSSALPRLCQAARDLGFFTVALIDGDPDDEETTQANLAASDAVLRLPDGMAIELALMDGLAEAEVRKALSKLDVHLPDDFGDLTGSDFTKAARRALKSRGGAHAEFIDALRGPSPKLATRILDQARDIVGSRTSGLVQL